MPGMGSKIQDFPDVVLRRGDQEFKSRWRGTQCICSSKYLFFEWMFAGREFKNNCVLRRKAVLGNRQFRVSEWIWAQNSWYVLFFRRLPSPPPPPPLSAWKGWISPIDHTQFPIGWRCTLLAGNSSITLAGSGEPVDVGDKFTHWAPVQ